jgi:hypothetical protein
MAPHLTTHAPRHHHPDAMSDDAAPGRLPPRDLGAEAALLSAALLSAEAAGIAAAVPVGDWYRPAHGYVANAIAALVAAGDPVDAVTVAGELAAAQHLDAVGGPSALIELQSQTPSTTNAAAYAATITGHAARRRVHVAAVNIADRALDPGADLTDLLDDAHRRLDVIPSTTGSTLQWADLDALLAGGINPVIPTDLLTLDDGEALLYLGRVHFFMGEPSAGKGWLALTACAQVIAAGGTAVYIDLEDTDDAIVGRLLALSVPPELIARRFRLVRPGGPLGATELLELETAAIAANADLVIIDGLAEALSNDGADENDNGEVTVWLKRVARRLAEGTGAAVVIIDHVAKSKDDRGRWMRGAGAKLASLTGVAYGLEVRQAFARNVAGLVDLIIAKDRPGSVGPTGATAAHFRIEPRAGGALVSTRLEAPSTDEREGKPTKAMTHVSGVVERNDGISRSQVTKHNRGGFGVVAIDRAIDALIGDGHVRAARKGSGWVLHHLRPYPDDGTTVAADPTTDPLGDF